MSNEERKLAAELEAERVGHAHPDVSELTDEQLNETVDSLQGEDDDKGIEQDREEV